MIYNDNGGSFEVAWPRVAGATAPYRLVL